MIADIDEAMPLYAEEYSLLVFFLEQGLHDVLLIPVAGVLVLTVVHAPLVAQLLFLNFEEQNWHK